jgi:hypothetical protein
LMTSFASADCRSIAQTAGSITDVTRGVVRFGF